MTVARKYTESVLVPRLRSLGVTARQRDIVATDVLQRLESLLFHWNDLPFRQTMLLLGTEEAAFWHPSTASLDVRSLVVVCVRNSLVEDLGSSHPYTKELRSKNEATSDQRMPLITSEAIQYFESADLDAGFSQPRFDLFAGLPQLFPNAWHVLSILAGSSELEMECHLPAAEAAPMDDLGSEGGVLKTKTVVASGIDPRFDGQLVNVLEMIRRRELEIFYSPSFKWITRNPKKLLSVINHVLRYGGTVLTANYLLSPKYLARRSPLIRPVHNTNEIEPQMANFEGLCDRHKEALASLLSNG